MGRLFLLYLSSKRIYLCATCEVHLSTYDDIESKAFQGRHGKAYLFRKVVNIMVGAVEKRMLRTGAHQVADIHCKSCQELLGWKYEIAYEEDQKYKEGKFILEKAKIKKAPGWE
eukprot:TRINITY_DN6307_c0_g1_i1.p2 TRINITY_DN6307_c0_g1~~TRINITY_DN6307_c0_g1_i1.p2  ORF type:complete len:114 (+),score=17.14 TRINITY_DN6307_c0_g1_i1:424-765(+)